jgi:hypothetical protein|nr:MAG TPA: hypothetical protein [Caudoviricetes sp.]
MYNELLGTMAVAGVFFTAGFAGAVWDFKQAQRKKARERKLEIAMEQYNNDIDEAMALGEQRVFDHLAEARKHSHSDNDWGMQEV